LARFRHKIISLQAKQYTKNQLNIKEDGKSERNFAEMKVFGVMKTDLSRLAL
jgi:hypothetical protein